MNINFDLNDNLVNEAYRQARERLSHGITFGHIDVFGPANLPDLPFGVYSFVYWMEGDNLELYYCVKVENKEE